MKDQFKKARAVLRGVGDPALRADVSEALDELAEAERQQGALEHRIVAMSNLYSAQCLACRPMERLRKCG
jgi:hypothetical protein